MTSLSVEPDWFRNLPPPETLLSTSPDTHAKTIKALGRRARLVKPEDYEKPLTTISAKADIIWCYFRRAKGPVVLTYEIRARLAKPGSPDIYYEEMLHYGYGNIRIVDCTELVNKALKTAGLPEIEDPYTPAGGNKPSLDDIFAKNLQRWMEEDFKVIQENLLKHKIKAQLCNRLDEQKKLFSFAPYDKSFVYVAIWYLGGPYVLGITSHLGLDRYIELVKLDEIEEVIIQVVKEDKKSRNFIDIPEAPPAPFPKPAQIEKVLKKQPDTQPVEEESDDDDVFRYTSCSVM